MNQRLQYLVVLASQSFGLLRNNIICINILCNFNKRLDNFNNNGKTTEQRFQGGNNNIILVQNGAGNEAFATTKHTETIIRIELYLVGIHTFIYLGNYRIFNL